LAVLETAVGLVGPVVMLDQMQQPKHVVLVVVVGELKEVIVITVLQ
jgi:hypothetical protein